jgi:hypothetical protein
MKKRLVIALCIALGAVMLAACGGSGSDSANGTDAAQTQDTVSDAATDGYSYVLNGTTLAMNAQMAPAVEALGDPDSYFESESCAFQGLDKVYTYGSVKVTTYPLEEVDYIYSIELMDDTVSTTEGISIGASKDDVTGTYGDASETTDTSLIYTKGDSTLAFIFDGDSVSAITYTAITE